MVPQIKLPKDKNNLNIKFNDRVVKLTNLTSLSLDNNPLTSPPSEIVQQGTQAILAYLQQRS